ncbi:MAG: symmetrical bis(5'-nucleosyl)-tetraphosphatase [Acidobacteria bacterium]|nr:symmetrical bis(5'-nucleosyl)-tetraphosphatase [Acidobacteriota bacterium]
MAVYAIGDIQGCWEPLQRLLAKAAFDPARDRLWLVGDLVNRGPASLEVLRWARELGDRAVIVLGNHDLHLIGRAMGTTRPRPSDTLDDVLAAPDRDALVAWLRARPFAHREGRFLMVHAGLLPEWTVADAMAAARVLEQALQGPDAGAAELLAGLHAKSAPRPGAPQSDAERRGLALAALVRIRCLDPRTGALDLRYKGPPDQAPDGLIAWCDAPTRREREVTLICGHWSALGLHIRPDLIAIDTGCWMGRSLTAVRLDDGAVFQVDADP